MTNDSNQQKAVIYVRVSSAGQVSKGHGAQSQAVRCTEFAKHKGYAIIRQFEDKAVSGSLVNRPGMARMLAFLKQNRGDGIRVIIDDISRLARGMQAHLALRTMIAEAGGVLESPSIEFGDDGDSQLVEHLLASVSEHARVKNAEQTRNRMQARMTAGYWPFGPCLGFKSEHRPGHGKVLVRDEPLASIIQDALEGFAAGTFQSQVEVKRFFERQPAFPKGKNGKVRIQLVTNILTRVLYAGMVESKDWGVSLRTGHHDGLISFETHQAIQDRIKGRKCTPYRKDISEDFPIRGTVACGSCGHPMTACWSTSKTGAKHPYYVCHQKSCDMHRKSIRRADVETAFDDLLRSLSPSKRLVVMITAMFRDAWDAQLQKTKQATRTMQSQLEAMDDEIGTLVDRIVSASHPRVVKAYEDKIDTLERKKLVLMEKAVPTPQKQGSFDEVFELCLRFLSNPYNLWKNGSFEAKKLVLRMVFLEPVPYCKKEGFRTPKTSNIFKALDSLTTKTGEMVPAEGLEPPTP